jgi:hypothetical protein
MKSHLLPHLVIFIVCFGILAVCFILTPPQNGIPNVQIGDISLPSICQFRGLTGIPCPGCGLLRSMVYAMHGDVNNSFEHHKLGLITIVYVALQFLFRLAVLLSPAFAIRFSRLGSYLNRGIILLAVLFGINWVVTLMAFF